MTRHGHERAAVQDDRGGHGEPPPAVLLRGARKTYGTGPAEVHALRDVDLEVRRGEFAVLLGPSGSGKTTLLNLIGGIRPATAGEVIAGGRDITGPARTPAPPTGATPSGSSSSSSTSSRR